MLAVDAGTTALKAALVAPDGAVIARASATYARGTRARPGARVEQRPDDWLEALAAACHRCLGGGDGVDVTAVVCSGQMQDVVAIGANRLVREWALLYSDARAAAQASAVEDALGTRVGDLANYKGAASCLAKWLWLAECEPDALARADGLLLGAHSYLAWALSGGDARVCDRTTAATTGLLDARTGAFAPWAVEALGLDPRLLPRLAAADEVLGQVTASVVERLGLPRALEGATLVHGCGDLGATTLGAGAATYAYLGTSGWLASSRPSTRDGGSSDAATSGEGIFDVLHPLEGTSIVAASMTTAGGCATWAAENVLGGVSLQELDALAARAAPGCGGLLFMPHIAGERSPFLDASARGAFLNVSAAHGQPEFARATLEGVRRPVAPRRMGCVCLSKKSADISGCPWCVLGDARWAVLTLSHGAARMTTQVALGYRSLLECLGSTDGAPLVTDGSAELPLLGGGARSALWTQMIADTLGVRVRAVPDADGAAARGAAALAFSSTGALDVRDAQALARFVAGAADCSSEDSAEAIFEPTPEASAAAADRYEVYSRLYPALKAAGCYDLM